MSAISCVGTGWCEAAGTYAGHHGNFPGMFLSESASGWKASRAPVPSDAISHGFVDLFGLSCAKVGSCVAVGDYADVAQSGNNYGDTQALVETDKNGAWTASKLALPKNRDRYPEASLYSLSCPAPTSCVAVGSYDSGGNSRALIVTRSGSRWRSVEAPLPPDAITDDDSYLSDVACPSSTRCTAVGGFPGSNAQESLVLHEKAGTWKPVMVNPSGESTNLDVVACRTATSCAAVGEEWKNSGAATPFAVSESNGSWTASHPPLPAGVPKKKVDDMGFYGLACPTSGGCVAGGYYFLDVPSGNGVYAPLMLTNRTGKWKDPTIKAPGGGSISQGELDSVSCTVKSSCRLVGVYQTPSSPPHPLVLRGHIGHLKPVSPSLAAARFGANSLSVVDCFSSTSCTAAGSYSDSQQNTRPWVAASIKKKWSTSVAAVPAGAGAPQDVTLSQGTCYAAGACVALGTNEGRSLIAERLVHGTWKHVILPSPSNVGWAPQFTVTALTCPARRTCVGAAIYLGSEGGVESEIVTLTKKHWRVKTVPTPVDAGPTPQAAVEGVSCWSVHRCGAVGQYATAQQTLRGLILTKAGGRWSAVAAPLPANANADPQPNLSAVSCGPGGTCVAVGYYGDSAKNTDALVLRGSAEHWKPHEAPIPSDGVGNFRSLSVLLTVDCGPKTCTATGLYVDKFSNLQGLILAESGHKWLASAAPVPGRAAAGAEILLSSVSCPSSTKCTAVGAYQDVNYNTRGLIVRGSGTHWKAKGLSFARHKSPQAALGQVACPATGKCQAVGVYADAKGDVEPLIASRSGGKWVATKADLPSGAMPPNGNQDGELSSVSCPLAGSCVAFGAYIDGRDVYQGLIEAQHS